ncbi:hypothetical protein BU25DRAFT_416966 [Macroventuria anomochaeta]|uniref:Uncharacterized protein n=1 Tax=Macroventuria anomochaeta TaxID=301207 RepID=A0ACB6SJS3_9PLEO|nr:uncharacterized protein BU25DRAFT_416966 [Macroventuria anomochaeta]KAF2633818.1 hypothetical protein BU25DRAFT_416966 [Macroventuria anomochaeta]
MQEYLNNAPGDLDAEITGLLQDQVSEVIERSYYIPLPQMPSELGVPCTVTIKYPAIIPHFDVQDGFTSTTPHHTPQTNNNIYPPNDWSQLPEKLQPPQFHVHRCHHEGVTSSTTSKAFELPLGFPEIVQYFHEVPEDSYCAGLFINIRSWLSPPTIEGGLQSFECHLSSTQTCFYITVERNSDILVYDCFRDEEALGSEP